LKKAPQKLLYGLVFALFITITHQRLMKKEESRFSQSLIFEGMTSIRACIHGWEKGISDRRIRRILLDGERLKNKGREISYLKAMSCKLGFDLVTTDGARIDSLTVGSTHGGIIAECTERTIPSLSDVTDQIAPRGFYAMIEGIEDPYNFGYAMRSLYACGCNGVILTPRNWMSAAGVVCRSSAGASEVMPLYIAEAEEAAAVMRSLGYKVVCAGIRDSVSSFDCDLAYPVFLVVGGEKRGISRAMLDLADTVVRIDYAGEFSGSLSAASAASMLAYEVMRSNRK